MGHESLFEERRSSDPVVARLGSIIRPGLQRRSSSVSRPTSPAFSDASSFDSGEPAWWVEVEDLYDTYHFDSRRSSMSSRASFSSVRSFMNTLVPPSEYDSRPISPDSSNLKTPRPTVAPLRFTDDWTDMSASRSRPKQPVFVSSQPSLSSGVSRPTGSTNRHRKLLSIEENISDLKRVLSDSVVEPDVQIEAELVADLECSRSLRSFVMEGPNMPIKKTLDIPDEKHCFLSCNSAGVGAYLDGQS